MRRTVKLFCKGSKHPEAFRSIAQIEHETNATDKRVGAKDTPFTYGQNKDDKSKSSLDNWAQSTDRFESQVPVVERFIYSSDLKLDCV